MKILATWVLGSTLAAAMVAAFFLAGRSAVERAWEEDPSRYLTAAERSQLAEAAQRRRELHERIVAKALVAESLYRGDIDLVEAARRFRELTLPDSQALRFIRDRFPDVPEDEMYCRHVITYLEGVLGDRPHEAEALRERLEAELSCLLEEGLLHLSD